jgi:hypothetical protein
MRTPVNINYSVENNMNSIRLGSKVEIAYNLEEKCPTIRKVELT